MSVFDFAIRLGSVTGPETDARLARMTGRGWHAATPVPGLIVAAQDAALICEMSGLTACGIVFLDNRAAVLDRLGQADAGQSDLMLAAALRAAEGPAFVTRLSGSFSLVVFDPASGTLEGYRDHFGVYPFVYCQSGGALVCASDPRAALHLSALPLEPDPARLADFIVGAVIDTESTAFAGLRRLPAAHRLKATDGQVTIHRYWRLEPGPEVPAEEAPEALRARLETATATRMRPPGPVGAMLSGGLDSSTLSGLAAREAAQRGLPAPQTLSFVYPDKPYDETPYIDAANAAYGTAPHHIAITTIPEIARLRDVVEEQMDLFSARGLNKSRRIYTEGRALGLAALLDGHGGDEVISMGYGRLTELAARRHWRALYGNLHALETGGSRAFWSMYLSYAAQTSGLPQRHPIQRLLMRVLRHLVAGQQTNRRPMGSANDLLAPALREQMDASARYAPQPRLTMRDDLRNAEHVASLQLLQDPMIESGFEALHRAAAAAGVEVRYPFFDRAVAELCVSMPSSVKLQQAQTRWVLKQAMRDLLPEMIRSRNSKANFHDEVDEGLATYHRSHPDALSERLAPYVDLPHAIRLRDRVVAGEHAIRDSIRLWPLTTLAFWLEALEEWRKQQAAGKLI